MSATLALVTVKSDLDHPHFFRVPGYPPREYYAFVPRACLPGSEPLVLVHGISGNAAELILRFAPLSRRLGVPLIAPVWSRKTYRMYQQVIDPRREVRADLALFDMLADAAGRFGLGTGRFSLFGFSGGGQFAHRFAMLHPERVGACIPVSSGWYCWPDPDLDWPMGLARAPLGPVNLAALAAVPFHVIVGDRDTHEGKALRHSAQLDALQGTDRLQRARNWFDALRGAGLNGAGSFSVLARTRHSFDRAQQNGLVGLVFGLLGHPPELTGK